VTDPWDPEQYRRFAAERRQPFDDLKGLCMPIVGGKIVDLGCGTGELTAELHRDMRATSTLGIDRSEAMLAEAASRASDVPGLSFERADLGEWHGTGFDLVFANASLHWAPDHPSLLARLRFSLAPGGQLAFQVPATFGHPSHVLAAEVAAEPAFAGPDGDDVARPGDSVLAPARCVELLYALGAV
jgi:trans-aconitate 2-methyltransferase